MEAITGRVEVRCRGQGVLGVGRGGLGCGISSLSFPRCWVYSLLQEDSLLSFSWEESSPVELLSMTVLGVSCIECLLDAKHLTYIVTFMFHNILSR